MTTLQVWLHGEHVGEVQQLRNGSPRLRFSTAAITRWGERSPVLSLALPISAKRVEGAAVEAFLDGLLPEGALRAQLDYQYGSRTPIDLLAHIGQECAGAVQFTTSDSPPSSGSLRPLSDAELAELVRDLPTLSPPDGLPIGASLGGVQPKLLLTQTEDGWAWPVDGAMSTHLVKPSPVGTAGPPLLVASEHWAMQVAAAAGVPTATTSLQVFDGREAIIVERFDRRSGRRLHQEDFTQALSVPSSTKYEPELARTNRLRTVHQLAHPNAANPREFSARLLEAVAFNALVGNGDAHSKNYSLTIDSSGVVDIAPLYDVAPVMFLGNYFHAGHAVAGQTNLKYITRRHLVDEAIGWGVRRARAEAIVDELRDRVIAALEATAVPDELAAVAEKVTRRVTTFPSGDSAVSSGSSAGQPRQPKGAPAGGEWRERDRPESDVDLI
ncbi:MAG: type II toxin-antitoxin system HipA family toxin [Microcella sp.]